MMLFGVVNVLCYVGHTYGDSHRYLQLRSFIYYPLPIYIPCPRFGGTIYPHTFYVYCLPYLYHTATWG